MSAPLTMSFAEARLHVARVVRRLVERVRALGARPRRGWKSVLQRHAFLDLVAAAEAGLAPDEVLLWPPAQREARVLGGLSSPRFALCSGWARDPVAVRRLRVDAAIPLAEQADSPALIAFAQATGAREVAVQNDTEGQLVAALIARGHDAYAVGPPRQMDLFAA